MNEGHYGDMNFFLSWSKVKIGGLYSVEYRSSVSLPLKDPI